ncbi:hypothetical protein BSL78_28099 [Apostichopus japonicus]|uniref:Uncharacterized protein n=1 Tax=Stichopus japonicus TaxID=307972 RepID=A0A2G8JH40_STIJA|nr:hypothetical protein BSL78_28099 [Apostichopus japonicus]
MFFTFSLASYYASSYMVGNFTKFLAHERDLKRKPFNLESPVTGEDSCSLLCLKSECLLQGLPSNILVDHKNDPARIFLFPKGDLGITILPRVEQNNTPATLEKYHQDDTNSTWSGYTLTAYQYAFKSSTGPEQIQHSEETLTDSPEAFSNQGIWKLEAVSDIYAEAFKSMGISHREQFDKVFFLDKYKHDEGILELHKQMLKLESELDDLMKTLDKSMDGSLVNITRAIVGSKAPLEDDIQLWLVPNKRNHVIDLIDHVETLKEHKVKTIVISGGTFEAAQEWKVKASCPFDVLVDEGGKLFKAFGLGRSYVRGWSMNTATFFAEWRAAGIPSITNDFEPRDMDSLRLHLSSIWKTCFTSPAEMHAGKSSSGYRILFSDYVGGSGRDCPKMPNHTILEFI